MSKAAKQCIIILIILLFAVFVFAGITLKEKLDIAKSNDSLEQKIAEYQTREKKYLVDHKKLQETVKKAQTAKAEIEKELEKFGGINIDELDEEIKKLSKDRDDWKKRVDALRKERDDLLVKLQEKPKAGDSAGGEEARRKIDELEEALSAKDRALREALAAAEEAKQAQETMQTKTVVGDEDDFYWAQVLKEKAALELELQNLKSSLTDNAVEVVELQKKNSDIQLELGKLNEERDSITRDIKHGKDLADMLSLELARSKNDNKFLNDRVGKLSGENTNLREQIKRLTSTKIALEKSIVLLQDEKKDIERKLLETENVIQSRIDQIWKIKDSLDQSFKPTRTGEGEIELPPIVVSAQGSEPEAPPAATGLGPGFDGNVVSVNEDNNFVIVDIGEISGVRLGDQLSVYRGADYVAGLEVIQVRKDIAAADIRNKVVNIQIGDIVR